MNQNLFHRVTSVITATIVCILCILFMVMNQNKFSENPVFSENENRYLTVLPKPDYKSLRDGKVTEQLQDWFSDHFIARDFFMNVRAWSERALQKTEINEVYLCKDDFYIDKPPVNRDLAKIEKSFSGLAKKVENAHISLMLVPTALSIYSDKLPPYADKGSQKQDMDRLAQIIGISTINVYEELEREAKRYDGSRSDNNLYYRLDHHWTTYASYVAYQRYCKDNGLKPLEYERLKKEKISTDFKGTVYSKVNDFRLKGEEMWAYDSGASIVVKYSDKEEVFDTLFAKEYLEKKDKYSYFLNNLHPYIEITNTDIDTKDELVLIKDSYANCMVPMLTAHYKKIHVFDTRSYRGKVSEFVNQNPNIQKVLILYNMGTIYQDTGIGGIL